MARQRLADKMRHSIQVQEAVYRKMEQEDDACSSLGDDDDEPEADAEAEPEHEDVTFAPAQQTYRIKLVKMWNTEGAKVPNAAKLQKWQIELVDGKYQRR